MSEEMWGLREQLLRTLPSTVVTRGLEAGSECTGVA